MEFNSSKEMKQISSKELAMKPSPVPIVIYEKKSIKHKSKIGK